MADPVAPRSPEALTLERLRQVVDVLEEGVAILGADGVVEFINPAGEEILGVPAGELLGWKPLDFRWEMVDSAGRPLDREAHPILRVLATGKPHPPVVVGMTSPLVPEPRWIEVSAQPIRSPNEPAVQGAVASFRDVSARRAAELALKASEARYQTMTQSLPTGIFHLDVEGLCVWVNHALSELTGRSVEECLGLGLAAAIHPDDFDRVVEVWRSAAAVRQPYVLEHRYLVRGEVKWVVCRAVELTDAQGRCLGYVGSVTDITEAKSAALMKDQVIGLVSHELRAPLVSIRGGLTFLEPYIQGADEDGRRLYRMALRNTELLERLVRDLLDIERLKAGQLGLNLEEVSVSEVLSRAREVTLPLAEERGVVVRAAEPSGAVVSADRDRMLQVFTNLLSNAVKFSEPGGEVRMEVSAGADHVTIGVHDKGRGIPPEYHERIFERFAQVEGGDAAERDGAGLGLAISRAIVNRHGGRIWVESTPGAGASFFVTLPVS
ncbi:MAG: PAS domain-containing sensor histidine kinase [Longimicrobiales bacterium]|nr:PAS domain-containing sensor histidine kinase [Longimicrobiales bacterium]